MAANSHRAGHGCLGYSTRSDTTSAQAAEPDLAAGGRLEGRGFVNDARRRLFCARIAGLAFSGVTPVDAISPFKTSVCGIEELAGHCGSRVSHVLSILDPNWPVPDAFGAYGEHARLELRFHDVIEEHNPDMIAPRQEHIADLLAFGRGLLDEPRDDAHLLVHCHAGVSRSTASMALILAQALPDVAADRIFAQVLHIRPRAWPNLRILEIGDALLGRRGELVAAAAGVYRTSSIGGSMWPSTCGRTGEVERSRQRCVERTQTMRRVQVILTLVVLISCPAAADVVEPNYAAQRAQMIRTIEAQVSDVSSEIGRDHIDPRVLKVMGSLPRHEFVPEDLRRASYADHPLPIGYGQTISQPLIVALMTDLLNIDATSIVLEVGTGSGYQAAVVAALAQQVYTIEIIPDLAHSAADRLHRLGYTNVTVRVGDGYFGWPDAAAPFDGIIVTAAAAHIPPPLLQQLKPGGRMAIPVGPPFGLQHLTVVERGADGRVRTRQLFPVKFVPLTGQHP